MANDYFQFQQFRIAQGACAQKVSTDACLLGAAADLAGATRVLDIGTGTGLLALMAAQRAPAARIDAVELDPAAAAQAAANVAASPWPTRVRVHALSLAAYAATAPAPLAGADFWVAGADFQFSHIICNPPFFQRSLLPPAPVRAVARHEGTGSLTFAEIVAFAARFLLPAGRLAVLLPPPEMGHFAAAAQQAGLAIRAQLGVRHRPGGRLTRCIWEFGPGAAPAASARELTIEALDGQKYSADFRQLLGGFYLQL